MRNTITLDDGRLVVEPVGLDRLWGFRRRIEVPLAQVRGATYDPGAAHAAKGLRAPGLALPGRKWVGTFRADGERCWWNVVAGGQTVVVSLREGSDFDRLYLTVDDARGVVDRINAAATG